MIIHCLFGQMAESYEGQNAPELLCAVDEYTLESAGDDLWDRVKTDALKDGYEKNFVALKEIDIEVSDITIRSLLRVPKIKGAIVAKEKP